VSSPPEDAPAVVAVPALLSIGTTARLLDCSAWTVRRRIADGSLPAVVEHGRVMVRADELRVWVGGLARVGASPARTRRRSSIGRYDFLLDPPDDGK
jgi:hypothetical protein